MRMQVLTMPGNRFVGNPNSNISLFMQQKWLSKSSSPRVYNNHPNTCTPAKRPMVFWANFKCPVSFTGTREVGSLQTQVRLQTSALKTSKANVLYVHVCCATQIRSYTLCRVP